MGDLVLAASYGGGDRRLVRSSVIVADETSSTVRVTPRKGYNGDPFWQFTLDTRTMTPAESVYGWDDSDPVVAPLRCPDGTRSGITVDTRDLAVACNCTVTAPRIECDCQDVLDLQFGCSDAGT